MQDALLDSRQVALLLNVSRSYVYLLMRRRDLPVVRMGRLIRVRRSAVRDYLASHTRLQRRSKPLLQPVPTSTPASSSTT
jgi:excisionase family DNA binding protein